MNDASCCYGKGNSCIFWASMLNFRGVSVISLPSGRLLKTDP